MRQEQRIAIGLVALLLAGAGGEAKTLQDSLAQAYLTNPSLRAVRATLRSVDEGVPQALSGWRPTIVLSGGPGYGDGSSRSASSAGTFYSRQNRDIFSAQASLTQPLYSGGGVRAGTNQAENRVYAQRARLLAAEEQVFSDTVSAYVGVIQAQRILALNVNNERVLARQLEGTVARFGIGEVTKTDVAQADAALAGAKSTRQIAEGTLLTARASYKHLVGELPNVLVEPQPLKLPVKNEEEAAQLASANNPSVIAALFDDAANRDAIDVAFSALMPQVSVQASGARNDNSGGPGSRTIGGQVVLNASVPLYQGGAEYSRVRQARQNQQQTQMTLEDARRGAVQSATQAWETLEATQASLATTRAQIKSNALALEGVTREAGVGSRTTLDVLNAQQLLLNSQVTLVQNLANLIIANYGVASAIGRLTARDLGLPVPLYDETAYYNAVRNRLAGVKDYATGQPGR
jgi:outer membrane protein